MKALRILQITIIVILLVAAFMPVKAFSANPKLIPTTTSSHVHTTIIKGFSPT
ncbi:hypothetical protein M0C34_21130 [Agarivorans sp. TSD2052]|uniref:hypothetical protein n=1 Tax=Agarivorans sp. TSD2052 TaxID=2937286 RepID=UPI0020109C4C|nr:hypothetical protein [Agarivorans sp. TSD2052]UPW18686.1 hypothetical protein M0C34_21130 [Agarivorans sp. TSD2052]